MFVLGCLRRRRDIGSRHSQLRHQTSTSRYPLPPWIQIIAAAVQRTRFKHGSYVKNGSKLFRTNKMMRNQDLRTTKNRIGIPVAGKQFNLREDEKERTSE